MPNHHVPVHDAAGGAHACYLRTRKGFLQESQVFCYDLPVIVSMENGNQKMPVFLFPCTLKSGNNL